MILIAAKFLVAVFAVALVAATLLPMIRSTAWWIRMWEFPRLHLGLMLAAVLPAVWILTDWPFRAIAVPVAACLVVQALRVLPFTRAWRRDMELALGIEHGDVTILASNVLMENEDTKRLAELIEAENPDAVLLMETDARWRRALDPVLAKYPTIVDAPKDNHYGIVFATRLEAVDARVVRLTPDETPAIFAELRDAAGRTFRLIGLHPRPPVPGQDTDERDTQMAYAARFARDEDLPVVVMGDFNEAAWSRTARYFKKVGGYVDPRTGRGMFASWHADHPLARSPIDQIYVTPDVAVAEFRIGPHVGSDHFPVIVRIRADPDLAGRLNRPVDALDAVESVNLTARLRDYAGTLKDPPL